MGAKKKTAKKRTPTPATPKSKRATLTELRADALALIAHASLTLGMQRDKTSRDLSVILAALHGAADGPAEALAKPLAWAHGRRMRGEGGWLTTSTPATRAEAVRSLLDTVERTTEGEEWTSNDVAFTVSTLLLQHAEALGVSIRVDAKGVRLDEVTRRVTDELERWGLGWDEGKRTDRERIARHCLMAVGLSETVARNLVNGALKSR